jgi:hypothetical protein
MQCKVAFRAGIQLSVSRGVTKFLKKDQEDTFLGFLQKTESRDRDVLSIPMLGSVRLLIALQRLVQ